MNLHWIGGVSMAAVASSGQAFATNVRLQGIFR